MANEDVTLGFHADEDVTEALRRIEQRLEAVERQAVTTGATTRAAGEEIAAGLDEAEESTRKLGDTSEETTPKVRGLGDEQDKTSRKTRKAKDATDGWGKSLDKAGKSLKGFGPAMTTLKFGTFIAGGMAAVGMINALGGGAVIAAAKIAGPMVGALAAVIPLLVAGKLVMLGWKAAAKELKPEIDGIKQTFAGVGPAFANAGLKQELDKARTSLVPLAKVAETGFAGIGVEVGRVAHDAVDLANSGTMLRLWGGIFTGLRPIVLSLGEAVLSVIGGVSYLFSATLPIGQDAADIVRSAADGFSDWAARVTTSGQATQWLTEKWNAFKYAVGVVVDFLKGFYNILRIASSMSFGFSRSIHDSAEQFFLWTKSAEGQNAIRDYFTKLIPVVRETILLIGAIIKAFAGVGVDPNTAALIAQLRTQLLPALVAILANVSQGGLLQAIVSLAVAFAQLFAAIDPQGLVIIVQSLAMLAQAVVWVVQNVPGMGMLLSILATFLIVGGGVLRIAGGMVNTFTWLRAGFTGAAAAGEKLTGAQRALFWTVSKLTPVFTYLGGVGMSALRLLGSAGAWAGRMLASGFGLVMRVGGTLLGFLGRGAGLLMTVFRTVGFAIVGVIRAIGVAMMSNPIIAVIMIIIGIILLLWFKCAWFRNAVIAIWRAIATAAVAAWDWLKNAWQAAVNFIVMVAMWIWDHGLGLVVKIIWAYWTFLFKAVVFIVKVAVFIIVGIITLIAIIAKWVFDQVVAAAQFLGGVLTAVWTWIVGVATAAWTWLWANVIAPVIGWIITRWTMLVAFFQFAWALIVAIATIAMLWIQNNIIAPVVNFITMLWNGLVTALSFVWSLIVLGATIAWLFLQNNVIQPVVNFVMMLWNGVVAFFTWVWGMISLGASIMAGVLTGIWNSIVGFLMPIFTAIGAAGRAVWDAIGAAANFVGGIVRGVWDGIVGAVKAVYNFLANAWNSIPSITVPAFVPLIGGETFSLPKLPMLEQGGVINYSSALVGEAGPEALVRNGRVEQMLGLNGPEIMHNLPKGGYVVPGLDTLSRMPGLARSIPSSVASAVSGAVPGYAELLGRTPHVTADVDAPPSSRDRGEERRHREMLHAMDRLSGALERDQRRPSDDGTGSRPPRKSGEGWAAQRNRYSYA